MTIKLVAAILLVTLSPASAKNTPEKICPALGELAERIMELRQSGVVLSELMTLLDQEFRGIAVMAYGNPQYSTEKMRATAARDFRNSVEHACYTADSWK